GGRGSPPLPNARTLDILSNGLIVGDFGYQKSLFFLSGIASAQGALAMTKRADVGVRPYPTPVRWTFCPTGLSLVISGTRRACFSFLGLLRRKALSQ
ncbi:MAG: hypothetical protein OEM52_11825, partial [bacterium]|nr:hypothetical protein [bacterium]